MTGIRTTLLALAATAMLTGSTFGATIFGKTSAVSPAGLVQIKAKARKAPNATILKVNAPDGPMPQFRAAVVDAAEYHKPGIIVHLENVSLLDSAELLNLVLQETQAVLADSGYTGDHAVIIQCPLQCGAKPKPKPTGAGGSVTVTVNGADGPMPPTRAAIMNAESSGVSRVIIHLENIGGMDSELVELELMEITQLLARYGYGASESEIIQCAGGC